MSIYLEEKSIKTSLQNNPDYYWTDPIYINGSSSKLYSVDLGYLNSNNMFHQFTCTLDYL